MSCAPVFVDDVADVIFIGAFHLINCCSLYTLCRGGLAKCNPIAYWTLEDTFDYIAKYEVPHHPLHAKGYPSIG